MVKYVQCAIRRCGKYVANVKFAAGYVFGYYGYYNKSGYHFGNDMFFRVPSKGPLEEVTLADQYLIFFRLVLSLR